LITQPWGQSLVIFGVHLEHPAPPWNMSPYLGRYDHIIRDMYYMFDRERVDTQVTVHVRSQTCATVCHTVDHTMIWTNIASDQCRVLSIQRPPETFAHIWDDMTIPLYFLICVTRCTPWVSSTLIERIAQIWDDKTMFDGRFVHSQMALSL
jgi:hypothetical protein